MWKVYIKIREFQKIDGDYITGPNGKQQIL